MLFFVVPPPTPKLSVMQIQHKSCSSAYPHQSSWLCSQVLLPLLPAQTYSLQIDNVQRTTVAAIHSWALISLERWLISYSYLLCFGFLFVCFCCFFPPPNITWRKKNHVMKKFHLSSLSAMLIEKNILYIADSLLFSSSVNSWHLLSHAWNINSPVQPHQIILYSSLCNYSQNKNNKKEGNFFVCVQKCFGLLGRLVGTWSISWKHRTSQILWTARILPKSQTFWYSFVNCVGWAQHPSEIMKAF